MYGKDNSERGEIMQCGWCLVTLDEDEQIPCNKCDAVACGACAGAVFNDFQECPDCDETDD